MARNERTSRGWVRLRGDASRIDADSKGILAIALSTLARDLHILSAADVDTDVNYANPTHPTLVIHSETTPATDYVSFAHDGDNFQLTVVGGGIVMTVPDGSAFNIIDDRLLSFGTGNDARFSWDTTDANANELLLQMPAGGAVNVPVLIIGQSIESVDPGLYNGVVDPRIAMFGVGAVTTGPVFEFRKARGTFASPTVVTTGDDLGTFDFYGAVAAGEYVRAASIRADMAGTIATTRGPGTLTFLTATDAAPSVLTTALRLNADQSSSFGGAVLPISNDLAALGSGTLMWSDLFLANLSVVNFNNGDVTITHAANLLTVAGGAVTFTGGLNVTTTTATVADGVGLRFGTSGGTPEFRLDTTDANAVMLMLHLTAGDATYVPVLALGSGITGVDLGATGRAYNGIVDPRVAIFASGAVTTAGGIDFHKARGTVAAPTVITTGDDLGTIRAYAAVANNEYVQSHEIRFDSTGTIATTRAGGIMRFLTATDAAPSVLTERLLLDAAGAVIIGSGQAGVTLAVGGTVRAPDITTGGAGNIAGADLTIRPGLGTGTGDEGQVIFQLPIVAGAGDNIQTLVTAAVLDMAGSATIVGLTLGVAGTTTGRLLLSGTTSGVVTVTPAAAAGTWTMQLPAAVGAAGEQLTDAAGNGVTSWAAAASLREYKDVGERMSPQDALRAMLEIPVHRFHYKAGKGTQDRSTEYVGVMADEAPQFMHYGGRIVNPVNTLGYTIGAVQALHQEIESLRRELAEVKSGRRSTSR